MSTIQPVSINTGSEAIQLLQKGNLPFEDINDHVSIYALTENETIIGTIGLEHDETTALLRSLSVETTERAKGHGENLVQFIEKEALAKGIHTIYLLTTTAANFFGKRGYVTISRSEVPAFIQQTSEFTSVCPSSAIVMKKQLA